MIGKDLDGSRKVIAALSDMKGIGNNLASFIINSLKIDGRMRMGLLNDKQIHEIQEYVKDMTRSNIPNYHFNHRKDPATGSNYHLTGADLDIVVKSEIDRERMIQSWRGVRHSLGLKLRGQRTRTTGRKGRSVGVKKSALRAASKPSTK